jgi:hypothetical protein
MTSRSEWFARVLPAVVFGVVSGVGILGAVLDPRSIGSHALIYTDAARAMVQGADPWSVGPPAAIYAGPPTMLIAFVPFTVLPDLVTRVVWVGGMAIVSAFALRRCGLPAYWIAFPPLFEAIVLGHPEPLVLGLLVVPRAVAGLAVVLKPYAALPLIAGERWRALGLAAVVVLVTALFLPWAAFVTRFSEISATLARQSQGDSTFGAPILMLLSVVALAFVGRRRALWLAVPLLWPSAQPIYKVGSVPALSPLLATIWAIPIPGFTLVGILGEAALLAVHRRRGLPPAAAAWLVRPEAARQITDVRYGSTQRQETSAT